MLPREVRLRRSADFSYTTRRGRRARSGDLMAYLSAPQLIDATVAEPWLPEASARPARIGLIVGKSVGNSVSRHRVSRRLRAQLAGKQHRLGQGDVLVVRALPGSADASSRTLNGDLDRCLRRLNVSL